MTKGSVKYSLLSALLPLPVLHLYCFIHTSVYPLEQGNVPGRDQIILNYDDYKFGFTKEQLIEGIQYLKKMGIKRFGIHSQFGCHRTETDYYGENALHLFEQVKDIYKQTGVKFQFINLAGGLGIPYKEDLESADIEAVSQVRPLSDRALPCLEAGDILIFHDTGAYTFSHSNHFNGKLLPAELLLLEDGSVQQIRRAEAPEDYFSTLDFPIRYE